MRRDPSRRHFLKLAGAGSAAFAAGCAPGALEPVPEPASKARLTGRVVLPGDPGYEDAREPYNGRFSRHPLAIAFCQDPGDVVNALRWAEARGVPLQPRSGRHSYEAFSTPEGGLVIDVSDMRAVRVEEDRRTAVVEAGASLLAVYDALGQVGVTIPAGSCPTVGIAGLTLGGGFGALSRALGLTCDSLVAGEMVTANGDVIHADETHEQDLLWACRGGGGGNFGIITSFKFKTHPIGDVAIFSATWRRDDLARVLDAWQTWAPYVDDRLTCVITFYGGPDGRVRSVGQLLGSEDELRDLLEPLLAAAEPAHLSIQGMPYLRAVGYFAGLGTDPDQWTVYQHHTQKIFKNTSAYAYEPFGSGAIAEIAAQLERAPSDGCLVMLDAYGGAVGRIPPEATAFYHRRALWSLQYQAYWNRPEDEAAHVEWVRGFRRAMLPYTRGAYVNYIDIDIEDWPTAYYGSNLARLEAIKARYDPRGVFCFPQSIPVGRPASPRAHGASR